MSNTHQVASAGRQQLRDAVERLLAPQARAEDLPDAGEQRQPSEASRS